MMAGRGPAPKDPSKRARANKDVVPLRTVVVLPTEQPMLPDSLPFGKDEDGNSLQVRYPAATVAWWEDWGASPFAPDFTVQDWHSLSIAALMHARVFLGDVKAATELRLWQQNFPATPGDRLRLRIQVAQAVDAEVSAVKSVLSSRDRGAGVQRVAVES